MHVKSLSLLVLPCLLLALGCGGDGGHRQTLATISGRVVAGPVAGATVTVRPLLDTGALGDPLGTDTTDAQGYFSFGLAEYDGPAVVLTRGGTYFDEATGSEIEANALEMGSLVVLATGEDHTAHVTVATTLAARRAVQVAIGANVDALAAIENGVAMVEEYYGIAGILTTLPADLTAGTVAPGEAAEYGALNAGFSQLAADRNVYLWSLIRALGEDASDGMFDGHFFAGPLYVEGPQGDGDLFMTTGGPDLQDAIATFAIGTHNASGLTVDDLSIDEMIGIHVDPDGYASCISQPRIDNVDPLLGPVNASTHVTLSGEFPDHPGVSLVVTFGGVPATVLEADDERILVTAPESAAAGKVDVTVACQTTGVHGTATDGFEYYVPRLVPVITDVKPETGPPVGGTLIEVTGENFDPSAVVEVDGEEAHLLARLGRTGLVVVAPSGVGLGTADITVRQAGFETEPTAPHATSPGAFTYVDEGAASEMPAEAELAGEWKAYALGHWYLDGSDTTVVLDGTFVFGANTFTETGDAWFATPDFPEGVPDTLDTHGPFRVFADGTLWLRPEDETLAAHAFLTDERDVFILKNDALTTGPMWLGAGIRRATGMSNASLTGTWHLALYSHAYGTGPDSRAVSSAAGTAEFDGAGHGSAGLTAAICTPDAEAWREATGSSLTYDVADDGTFTVTIPSPEEGGPPLVFHGSVTQAKDLAVAVSSSEGEAQFLMMVPVPAGFGPAHGFGSWYGGGLAYAYDPIVGNMYVGETTRTLSDGHGAGLGEVIVRLTSDSDDNGGMQTEVHPGVTLCETMGVLIGGPDDLSGFVGASRRFQIFLPANLEASPYAEPVEFMGAGLFLRRPAKYSSWTIDFADYNAVGISTEYKAPGESLSPDEENTSFRTTLSFSASAMAYPDETSDLIGRVRENAGARWEKTVHRWGTELSVDVKEGTYPEYTGPYAVFGDGRFLLSALPPEPELAASDEDMLEEIVGEITGNADLVLLRNAVNPDGASAFLALARIGDPTLAGRYNGAVLRFNYASTAPVEWVEAVFGYMDLSTGTLAGQGNVRVMDPVTGLSTTGTETWDGTYSTAAGGFVSIDDPDMHLRGIATHDGAAAILVDLGANLHTTLLIGLKQAESAVSVTGSYRWEGFGHEYVFTGPLPVWARKQVLSGPGKVTDVLDVGVSLDERTNAYGHVDRDSALFAGTSFVAEEDNSVTWLADGEYRGWVGDRYAFLMPATLIGEDLVPSDYRIFIGIR